MTHAVHAGDDEKREQHQERCREGDRQKANELGADAFVAKPFNVDELLRVLKELEPGTLTTQT